MQVIIVLTDVGVKNLTYKRIRTGSLTYSIFEKPQSGEKLDVSMLDSPSVQVGSMLSAFLKTVESHGYVLADTVINEERKKNYPPEDFRHHIKKYDNVIEVDLKKFKPKGKGN
jgi:flagellar basal body P-ring protein FlgI